MKQNYIIGVDISKAKVDCVVINSTNQKVLVKIVTNKDERLAKFFQFVLKKLKATVDDLLICCEETGLYTQPLKRVCSSMGLSLWVEQALKIKRVCIGMRGKSDEIDAGRIAEYAMRFQDKKRIFKRAEGQFSKLQNLINVRETLRDQIVRIEQEVNETKEFDKEKFALLKKCYTVPLKALKKQKLEVETQITELMNSFPEIKKNAELLSSIPGVGNQVAIEFIIATENFTRFETPEQMACYSGVAPFPNESGTIIKKRRVSSMANKKLKKLLHLAAMAASRAKGDLKTYYLRKVQEGKNKMVVLNAMRNKIVHRMFSVIRRQSPYVPELCIISNN
jgi:transposase